MCPRTPGAASFYALAMKFISGRCGSALKASDALETQKHGMRR